MSQVPFDVFKVRELPKDTKHWRSSFDSRYLRHFWLNGKPRIVTITKVQELESSQKKGNEKKLQLLITLAEADKPWAINVTNCDIIEMLYQQADPHKWIGFRVELYPTKTRGPTGAMVDCIRVREQIPAAGAKTEKPKQRQEVYAYLDDMKNAADLAKLELVRVVMVEDTELSADELAFLQTAYDRRKAQFGGAA